MAELVRHLGELGLPEVLLRGGWLELQVDSSLDPVAYLNDYVRSFLEKDIVVSGGIRKVREFTLTLGLLAARTACVLNASALSQESGRSRTAQPRGRHFASFRPCC